MAGSIPQSFIDEILARSDIVEVVGARVPLKKAGKEYKACCPFHDEKTPSFTVSQSKQFYHCFGCGEHGTAIGFVMAYDHLGFVEAIEELAGRLGLEVPREEGFSAQNKQTKTLYELMDKIAFFYEENLKRDQAAIDYLKLRGLDGKTAKRFRMGSVPDAWDSVLSRFGQDPAEKQKLDKAGMLSSNDAGRQYDRFRGRIMFPIRDSRGRVIAFGGRVLKSDDKGAKYLNSPETPIYHKGEELYGLYEAKQAIRHIDKLLVVEGYMDVVALAQAGIDYAVATLGTATTTQQARKLVRTANKIIFCFDGDRAGRQAAWKALENILPVMREGLSLNFLFLPDGHDPDTYIREYGTEKFIEIMDQSDPLSEYFFKHLSQGLNLKQLDDRANLANRAQSLLKKLPIGIFRDMMIDELARRTQTSRGQLERRLLEQNDSDRQQRRGKPSGQVQNTISHQLVKRAIKLLVHIPKVAAHFTKIENLSEQTSGMRLLIDLLDTLHVYPNLQTFELIERFRQHPHSAQLSRLAAEDLLLNSSDGATIEFIDIMEKLSDSNEDEQRLNDLMHLSRTQGLSLVEKQELANLLAKSAK